MRIAQIAPLSERVPAKKYGGTERVTHDLTEELVKMGHQVTLFASGDSLTSARLVSVYPKGLREAGIDLNPYSFASLYLMNIGVAYQMQDEFDIIHDHNDYFSLPTAIIAHTPVVMTLHGAFTTTKARIFERLNKPYFVSISNAQRKSMPNLNYIGNVYNGLNFTSYPFSKKDDGYLLFVGRIDPEKGVDKAIEVAEFLDLPLIIAAKLDYMFRDYFEEKIKSNLNDRIKWIGEIETEERNNLMSKAICVLHPITWKEPFGLTMIESMACGAPVVAFNRGSVPEIVKDGKTGYIVEDTMEMVNAVRQIHKISREDCRKYALKKFNSRKMAEGYEKTYQKVIDLNKEDKIIANGKKLLNRISKSDYASLD